MRATPASYSWEKLLRDSSLWAALTAIDNQFPTVSLFELYTLVRKPMWGRAPS